MSSPDSIAGLQLWLKADAITGLSDADPVTTWSDASGNGYHVTQATAAKKPTYETNELNGKPVVRFDGVDDILNRADGGEPNYTAVTIFAVQKLLVPGTTAAYPWSVGNIDAVGEQLFWESGPNGGGSDDVIEVGARGTQDKRATLTGIAAQNVWKIIACVAPGDNNNSTVFANGSAAAMSGTPVATFNLNVTFQIGGLLDGQPYYGQVDLAEVIVYNSALSAADRQHVEEYLSAKYAIATTGMLAAVAGQSYPNPVLARELMVASGAGPGHRR